MMNGANCCGVADVFDEKHARGDLDAYRRRGPSASTARLLSALRSVGQPFDTLLDVGGGVGAIAHELLASGGVSRATLVDGSTAYLAAANEESGRRTTGDRLHTRYGDLVEIADDVEPADVVTLDKVVCCYPDMDSLLAISAARARRLYGIVYPRDGWWVRAGIAIENRVRRWTGGTFRGYAHSNAAIDEALRRAGLVPRFRKGGVWWVIAVYERRGALA
jgi:magnesium-protoporphyrin O-methyltransferase